MMLECKSGVSSLCLSYFPPFPPYFSSQMTQNIVLCFILSRHGWKKGQSGAPDFPVVSFYQRFTAFFPLRSYDHVISVSTLCVFKQCLFCDVLLLEITDFHRTCHVVLSFSLGIHNATKIFCSSKQESLCLCGKKIYP